MTTKPEGKLLGCSGRFGDAGWDCDEALLAEYGDGLCPLHAAAPELLEACKKLLDGARVGYTQPEWDATESFAKTVIARAEGGLK